jgi:hypothetical protein
VILGVYVSGWYNSRRQYECIIWFQCCYATCEEADSRANLVPASCRGESSMYCTPAQYFVTSHQVSASAEGLSLIEEQDGGSPVVYYLTKSWVGNRS